MSTTPENTPTPRLARPRRREFLGDSLTPLAVYRRLASQSPYRFLFESVVGGDQVSRFSFLGVDPTEILRLYPDRLEIERGGDLATETGDPIVALRRALARIRAEPGDLPFTGGFVGYFGYDLIRSVERLPPKPRDPFGLPVAILARFDRVIVFDHAQQRVIAVANEIEGECSAEQADLALDELEQMLNSEMHAGASRVEIGSTLAAAEADSSLDGADYRAAVERAQEYIRRGDIFQVVLARRFSLRRSLGALDLYRALRRINPSPYMVLLESPEASLVGASPEMLVRKTGNRVETRPIAGTRPRGESTEEDERLAESLLRDEKERAEHVMLVDLGRNDLGRVAKVGSIELPQFMEIERYSHVMHIVSSVAGDCSDSSSPLDVLLACFPAGTVSGAPKIRAMEIIDELEPESRGPYAGAVGYISFTGDLDTCITIRTLVVKDGEVSVTAGAGIVADSVPATEERETESKAAALLAAVDLAEILGG